MKKTGKMCLVLLVVAALAMMPASAMAEGNKVGKEASAGAMTADIVMARPIGLLSLILGSSMFVVSLPLSGLGGNVDSAARNLVVEPAKYTFKRPLGEF
ncbi:MAG: hypothetical protein K9J83_07605 [Desulfarculaceae bacterium]|nr:hypothetical protein [Desulfarculaceae bacterium]